LCALVIFATTIALVPMTGFAEIADTSPAGETRKATGYGAYITAMQTGESPSQSVHVDLSSLHGGENVRLVKEYAGKTGDVVLTEETGRAEWTIEVSQAGLYTITLAYYPMEGTSSAVQRRLLIDGTVPFEEASQLEFGRVFARESTEDEERQTVLKEEPQWLSATLQDASGFYGPLQFYLTQGTHSLALESIAEPMAIASVTLNPPAEPVPNYTEAVAAYQRQGASAVQGVLKDGILKVQAEDTSAVSSPALYASADNTSPANEPYIYNEQKINVIGGTRWQEPGAWITWKIEVPESGLYHIGYRFKQNYLRDVPCVRSLRIDGEIPFSEAQNMEFAFDSSWQVTAAGGDTPYLFYLDKGSRTITLEVTLGALAPSLLDASQSLDELNTASWRLLTLLGSEPDLYRDYNIDQYMPDVIEVFRQQAAQLKKIAASWVDLTGKQDSNVAQMNQLAYQLDEMVRSPGQIPGIYSQFRDALSTFANLLLDVKKQPLLLDYLFIAEPQAALPTANVSFFLSLKDGVQKFLSSFVSDYNNLSGGTGDTSITVWVGNGLSGGRDQAMVLRRLIQQQFSPSYGTAVNLQLVPATTILTATVAGLGPDVALQVSGGDPANYAMRGAVADLSLMEDFDQVAERFSDSALVPYRYRGGIYALPETFSFLMMFYRRDILEQLGIDIGSIRTWQDLIGALPTIQGQNMNVSLMPNFNSYAMFLYQNQGQLYSEDGSRTALDSKTNLDAFHYFMRLFTDYNLPYAYNFVTRFRTGEIVIGIEDYTNYNLLQISAPEISGRWGMTTIPGIAGEDGAVQNISPSSGSGCVLMSASKNKEAAWKFMKWLTSSDTQYQYGKELESVMGVGARYNTANLEALARLPWRTVDKQVLLKQLKATRGIPEVPGGYMTSRNVGFAIATVYSENVSARDTLLGYVNQINREMALKRREFGLQ